ncbi:MAG TPA: HlyD family efflux transporter periplasmic adaptor subunit [Planctomycetota bacterium]|jgi:multidrug resistance efflux pump|nr:HlyD family efflux transporter periplasmic adaptor subunit [Planctomycetota bacterium]
MRIILLDPKTPVAETLLAKPPRVLGMLAAVAGALLAASAVGAFFAWVDLGVSAPVRIRPDSASPNDVDAVSGERLSAGVAGRVAELRCREGDEVRRGDVLVRLETSKLETEIARAETEEKSLSEEISNLGTILRELDLQEEAELAKLRAAVAESMEGVRVEKDRRRLEEERLESEEAIAALALAERRKEASLLREQVDLGIAPRIDFERAERALRQSEARWEQSRLRPNGAGVTQAERRLDLVRAGMDPIRKEFARDRAEQRSRLAARSRDLDSTRKTLAILRRDRDESVVRAPAAGVVTQVAVHAGDVVEAGRPLLAVAEQKGFRADASVSAADIGHVRPGMKGRIRLDAFDASIYGSVEGTVTFVSPDLQLLDRRIPVFMVRMTLDQPVLRQGAHVKLGMTGRADILAGRERLLWVLLRSLKDQVISP